MDTSADDKQVGGSHYKSENIAPNQEHWNLVTAYQWDYFQSVIIKYLMRWKKKNGMQDLLKAQHFLEKYIEINSDTTPIDKVDKSEFQTIVEEEIAANDLQKVLLQRAEQIRQNNLNHPVYKRAQEERNLRLKRTLDSMSANEPGRTYVNPDLQLT